MFAKGWRQRRAAAQSRAELAKNGSNEYRTWAIRQREIEGVGRNLVTLVERHGALLAEMKEVQRRLRVKEHNAAAADTVIDADDVVLRLRARLEVLPSLVDAAHAIVETERARVAAERAIITARHAAEDAAQTAVVNRETQAEAAARRARDAIMFDVPPVDRDVDLHSVDAQTKSKRTAH